MGTISIGTMTASSVYFVLLILSICFLLKTECRVFLVETGKEPVVNKMPDKHQILPELTTAKKDKNAKTRQKTGKKINKGEVLDEGDDYFLEFLAPIAAALLPHAVHFLGSLLGR